MTDACEDLHAYGVHLEPNLTLNMYWSGNCFHWNLLRINGHLVCDTFFRKSYVFGNSGTNRNGLLKIMVTLFLRL